MKSNVTLGQSMKGVSKAMRMLNTQLNLPALQRVMMEFEKQSEIFDMKEEMMSDAIDDALDEEDAEEDAEEEVNKVFAQLNLEFQEETAAPVTSTTSSTEQAEQSTDDLSARLAALKGNS